MTETTLTKLTQSDGAPHRPEGDRQIAEQATIQSFFNCYLRETQAGERQILANAALRDRLNTEECICCNLSYQGIQIFAGLRYYSPTGRHLFAFPLYYQPAGKTDLLELDYVTLTALIAKELMSIGGSSGSQDELLLRVIQSCRNIEQFVQERKSDSHQLYSFKSNFINTEQSLVFGHHLHPTPKSRQGFSEDEMLRYSPESKGRFSLHYFRAHQSIVQAGSNLGQTATQLIKAELQRDSELSSEFKNKYCQEDGYSLIPIHPWQAQFLSRKPAVQQLIEQGLLEDLGQQGKAYLPTSSIRTVYHPASSFMFKLSLNVKITNSLRANLYKELERGVEVTRILDSEIGQNLTNHFPQFRIVRDPAYITIKLEGEPSSGFATVLRENPFLANPDTDVTCLIALCQDAINGSGSRLSAIIHRLAQQENCSLESISLDWFQRYLDLALNPILWLYFTYGIAVEAHQQNSLLQLKDGYPNCFFYRDNQGYYYRESFKERLQNILPTISEKSQTFCEDAVIDERLGYYLVMNNILGVINAFGTANLIDENQLLHLVRQALENHQSFEQGGSLFLPNLLDSPQLRCKGNLLTRFHDMDELVGSVATQSVYVTINNPLFI